MMGEGKSYKERHQERVICPEGGRELANVSLVAHRQTKNCLEKGGLWQDVDKEGRGNKPRSFRMAFPAKEGLRPCPVKGCSDRSAACMDMRANFWYQHDRDTVLILE